MAKIEVEQIEPTKAERHAQYAFIDRMAWISMWLTVSGVLLLLVCAVSLIILVRVSSVQSTLDSMSARITSLEERVSTLGKEK